MEQNRLEWNGTEEIGMDLNVTEKNKMKAEKLTIKLISNSYIEVKKGYVIVECKLHTFYIRQ